MALDEGFGRQPTAYDLRRKKEEKLYNAVRSGKVRLEDLNDDGLKALESHLGSKNDAYSKKTDQEARSRRAATANEAALSSRNAAAKEDLLKKVGLPSKAELPKGVAVDFAIEHPTFTKAMLTVSKPMRDLLENTSPGKFISRTGETAGDLATFGASKSLRGEKTSTGSSGWDTTADIAGDILGIAANPSGTGSLGNVMGLSGKASEKGLEALVKKLPALDKTGRAGRIFAQGSGMGTAYQTAKELEEGKDKTALERVKDIGIMGGLFGAGDVVLHGAGKLAASKLGPLLERLKKKPAADIPQLPPIAEMPKPAEQALKDAVGIDLPVPQPGRFLSELPFAAKTKEKVIPIKDIPEMLGRGKAEPIAINTSPKPLIEKALSLAKDIEPVPTVKEMNKSMAEEAVINADAWKDKGGLLGNFTLNRETIARNFEDVMGQDADRLKRIYVEPIAKSEAERIRFVDSNRKQIASLGIKAGSQESALVHKLGEGLITLDELKKVTPNWEKIVKAKDQLRNWYDEILPKVNEVLAANGHEAIPYRKNYFPHVQELSKFDKALSLFGIRATEDSLPTDLAGLTANFKPTKNYNPHAMERKTDSTRYDAIGNFDRYIDPISRNIYQTNNIGKLRALVNSLRDKYEGQTHLNNFVRNLEDTTNVLAGKQSELSRGEQAGAGRKLISITNSIINNTSLNMVGGNIASALSGTVAHIPAVVTTNKSAYMKGLMETVSNVFKNDGFVQKSDFLARRIGSDPLERNLWEKTVDKSMWLMKAVDNFNAQAIVRGKYIEGISKGLSEKQAMKQADNFASRLLGERSKGLQPMLFESKAPHHKLLTQFQHEVNNTLSFMFKDIPNMYKGNKVGLASAVGQAVLYTYLFNELSEKITGRRIAPFDIINTAIKIGEGAENDKPEEALKAFQEGSGNSLPFTSLLIGGGRIPAAVAAPDVVNYFSGKKSGYESFGEPLQYAVLPGLAGLIKRSGTAATDLGINPLSPQPIPGKYDDSGKLKYPIADTDINRLQGLLFGSNALLETRQYYDKDRRVLSEKQTKQVENSADPMKAYEQIMTKRQSEALQTMINNIKKNKDMSTQDKQEKINELIAKLRSKQIE